jgi:hypothetical protein
MASSPPVEAKGPYGRWRAGLGWNGRGGGCNRVLSTIMAASRYRYWPHPLPDDELDRSNFCRTPCVALCDNSNGPRRIEPQIAKGVSDLRILWARWRAGGLRARAGIRDFYRVEIRTDAGPWSAVAMVR